MPPGPPPGIAGPPGGPPPGIAGPPGGMPDIGGMKAKMRRRIGLAAAGGFVVGFLIATLVWHL